MMPEPHTYSCCSSAPTSSNQPPSPQTSHILNSHHHHLSQYPSNPYANHSSCGIVGCTGDSKPISVCATCEASRVSGSDVTNIQFSTIQQCQPPQQHMDCDYCTKMGGGGPVGLGSYEKLKASVTGGALRPTVPIKKKKGGIGGGGKGKGGRGGNGAVGAAAGGVERDSKMAKEMTAVLSAIPGMEKVRWQSIIQSTRGPEVGDRETQRRVKEAEVLVGKVFGGDVRRMLTLLMNEHLDFLVKFVSTTLSTSRRGHKKVRDQVFNALKEIKEREAELEGENSD